MLVVIGRLATRHQQVSHIAGSVMMSYQQSREALSEQEYLPIESYIGIYLIDIFVKSFCPAIPAIPDTD